MASKIQKIVDELTSSSQPLHVVEIYDQYMQDEGCRFLCNKLSSIDSVHTIDLRGNDIQETGVQSLVQLIQQNRNIKTLKLEWNLIGLHDALSVLCDGLISSNIMHLDLRNNKIDSNGGKILGDMLANNTTLRHLDLRWNNLGSIGGQCILHTLQQTEHTNCTLTECLLSGNQIPVHILRSIENQLKKHKQLQLHANTKENNPACSSSSSSSLSPSSCSEPNETKISTQMKPALETESELDNVDLATDDKNETIESMQQEINELFATKTSLNEDNEMAKIKIAELETENADFKDSSKVLENEKKRLEDELAAMQKTYDTDTEQLKQKIHELQVGLDETCKSRQSDKCEFDSIRESIQNQHEIEVNKLRETKEFELNSLRKTMNELHIEINELKTSNNSLRSEILQNEIVSERKCIEFEKNLRQECNQTLSERILDLERNIEAIKQSRDALEVEMKSETQKYQHLVEKIEAEKQQYQEWLNEEQKRKSRLETEQRSLGMELQKSSNVITQKNQQIESLKIGLKETQKSIKSLEKEHTTSMKRVLSEHNRQVLALEKSLRECEQRLTITEHRKRNLELRVAKIEDEEQRKIAAVYDAIKCLRTSFELYQYPNKDENAEFKEQAEEEEVVVMKKGKKKKKEKEKEKDKNKKNNASTTMSIQDGDDEETIIEIIDDDEDAMMAEFEDFMRDHSAFNSHKKKKNKTKTKNKNKKIKNSVE